MIGLRSAIDEKEKSKVKIEIMERCGGEKKSKKEKEKNVWIKKNNNKGKIK